METVAQVLEAAAELAREHDEIDRLTTHICTLAAGTERRTLVLETCTRYLVHARVEERLLLPAVRRHLPDGEQAAVEERSRHHGMLRTIGTLRRLYDPRGEPDLDPDLDPDLGLFDRDDALDIVIGQLVTGIQCHVEQQDSVLLPQLHRMCPLAESRRLGEQLREAVAADAEDRPRRHGFRELLRSWFRAPRPVNVDQPTPFG